MNDLLAYLKTVAARDAHSDREDFTPDDAAGGNIDDAYDAGCTDGEIFLARWLVEKFG